MTVDEDNRLATFNGQAVGCDWDGNMTTGPLTNNTLVIYGYNARNQLTSAGGLGYAYDPAGNRLAVTNGANVTRYVINPNAKLPQTLMRIRSGVTNYYIYGQGLLLRDHRDGHEHQYADLPLRLSGEHDSAHRQERESDGPGAVLCLRPDHLPYGHQRHAIPLQRALWGDD